jgi:hypothetical protein
VGSETLIPLRPFMCDLCARSLNTQVVCGVLFMTCMLIGACSEEVSEICVAETRVEGRA